MPVSTSAFNLQAAKQTAKGAYPTDPTYLLQVTEGGLGGAPTVDTLNVADGGMWTPSAKRIGYLETGGTPTIIAQPQNVGFLLAAAFGASSPAGANPVTHTITPATAMTGFPYLTFWQKFDTQWSQFRDCQISAIDLECSIDNKFMRLRPTIVGMMPEKFVSKPGVPATAESDFYHWLDATGYWCVDGTPSTVEHTAVPTDLTSLKAWLLAYKTSYNAHCALDGTTGAPHHIAADAVNILSYATPLADDAACIAALTEVKTKYEAHRASAVVHKNADTANTLSYSTPCADVAACLVAVEEIRGYDNAPGVVLKHMGVRACVKSFKLSLAMAATPLQGEALTACNLWRKRGTISIAAEVLMKDFELLNKVKYGATAPADGAEVTSEIQTGALSVKFTANTTGEERSTTILVPQFDYSPEPFNVYGNPEGNEQYLTVGGEASGTGTLCTVTVKNDVPTY